MGGDGGHQPGGVGVGGVGDVDGHRHTGRGGDQRPGVPGVPDGGDLFAGERQPQDDQGGGGGEGVDQQRRAVAQAGWEGADLNGEVADGLEADHEGEHGDG
jgi:hypothetical protein